MRTRFCASARAALVVSALVGLVSSGCTHNHYYVQGTPVAMKSTQMGGTVVASNPIIVGQPVTVSQPQVVGKASDFCVDANGNLIARNGSPMIVTSPKRGLFSGFGKSKVVIAQPITTSSEPALVREEYVRSAPLAPSEPLIVNEDDPTYVTSRPSKTLSYRSGWTPTEPSRMATTRVTGAIQ